MANEPNATNDARQKTIRDWLIPGAAVIFAVAVVLVLLREGGSPMDRLKVVAGYLILILVFFYGLMVLIAMVSGEIDLKYLLSEADGSASMSRFQLLVFTVIIGLSLFLIIVSSTPPKFPEVPPAILTLLGISATTYAAGKALTTPPSEPPPTTEEEKKKTT
jgi:hypothetical protein